MPKRNKMGLGLLLATLVQPLAARAAVTPGALYASESAGRSIVELAAANVGERERFAHDFVGAATGLCYGGPNDDLYVAVASVNGDRVYVATEGGDLHDAVPFATGFNVALGLDCTSERVLLADRDRGVFDITAGGDFAKAQPFARLEGGSHIDVFTDSKGKIWLAAGAGGLYDVSAGGELTFADRFVHYDTRGSFGFLGIGELRGELHVTEGQFNGSGRVWNVAGLQADSRLSEGTTYATGVPYMANALLGVGDDLYVAGHTNECFVGTAVWNIASGGNMREHEPFTTGINSACYLMEEMAYIHFCGDGILRPNSAEQCDDAGDSASCDHDCTLAECGDGYLNAEAGEACDDGNTGDGDGCPATCRFEVAPQAAPAPGQGSGAEDPSTAEEEPLPSKGPAVAAEPSTALESDAPQAGPSAVVPVGCTIGAGSARGTSWSALVLALGLLAARRRPALPLRQKVRAARR